MALAFRAGSTTSAGDASGGSLSVTKGTGVVDNDILVVVLYLETDTNTWATVPSGWTSVFRQANTGAFSIEVFVKRAASEGASWAWVPTTNAWRTAVFAAYSGGTGTGTLLDVAAGGQGDAQIVSNQQAPTVTTTGANRMLIFGYGNANGANPVTLGGAATNLRVAVGGATIADALIASAGATGTTQPTGALGSQDYAAIHAALISDTAGAAATSLPPYCPSFAHLIGR